MNLHEHAKNQFIPFVHSSDRVNFRVPSHDWPHAFLTKPTPNILLTCMNLYQHAKNQLILEIQLSLESWDLICSICYGETVYLEIMLLIGWAYFGLHLRNKIFPKQRICAGTQQIINIFIIEQIQWKLMTKFSLNSKNLFLAHFPNCWGKSFSKNRVVVHNFIRVSSTLAKSKEI